MSWTESLILGLLQGLTEFLPVSSSGHLALANMLFGLDREHGALFEIFVHLGTALAVVTVYRRDVGALLAASRYLLGPARWRSGWSESATFRLGVLLMVSAVPAAAVGLSLQAEIEMLFESRIVVGLCLATTGVVLMATRLIPQRRRDVGLRIAIVMGLAQALAILPGISRSGMTISAGLAAGGEREVVGRFAFLMVLIPILGAAVLKSGELTSGSGAGLVAIGVGTLVSYLSGLVALVVLLRFVRRGRLHGFAPYCFVIAAVALVPVA
jgi:undecaprenyl-diphosphatase